MTEASGILFFNRGVSRGCLVDRYWKVVDIERAAGRGSRQGGYRCNGMKRCTAKSQMKALVTKSSRVVWTSSTPPTPEICLSSLKVTEFSISRTASLCPRTLATSPAMFRGGWV